jgi:hypothetical protein
MRRFLPAAVAIGLSIATALPALAGTAPQTQLRANEHSLSVGLWDGSFDVAVSDTATVGLLATAPFSVVWLAGVRATFRTAGDPNDFASGYSFSGGLGGNGFFWAASPLMVWFQPAWSFSNRLGDSHFHFRGALGPTVTVLTSTSPEATYYTPIVWLIPNVELTYRFNQHHEVSIGTTGLIGYRARF